MLGVVGHQDQDCQTAKLFDIHTISNVQQQLATPINLGTIIHKYAFRFN
jgi:hypothetical protein